MSVPEPPSHDFITKAIAPPHTTSTELNDGTGRSIAITAWKPCVPISRGGPVTVTIEGVIVMPRAE